MSSVDGVRSDQFAVMAPRRTQTLSFLCVSHLSQFVEGVHVAWWSVLFPLKQMSTDTSSES